jgi:hypothetical protein
MAGQQAALIVTGEGELLNSQATATALIAAPRRFNMTILRFRSKEEQILVEAAEERARQEAKYADEDWNSLPFNVRTGRVLTQVHKMEKK